MNLIEFKELPDESTPASVENINHNFKEIAEAMAALNNKKDIYSTEEIKTNKVWIDGKPIYRIALSFTSPSAVNTWKNIYVSMTNPETIVNLSILISYSGYTMSALNNSLIECAFQQSNLRIVQRVSDSTYLNCNEVAVIEYTKTND